VRAELGGTRHSRGSGRGGRIHVDRAAHGGELESRAQELAAVHVQRRATLGVDPKLVLVFELAGAVSAGALRAAGLTPLGGTQGEAVVAFADDPQLHGFLKRVREYRDAGNDVRYAPNEAFVDVLNAVRPYGPQDRTTPRLLSLRDAADGGTLDIQLDLWHPGDNQRAEAWMRETVDAIVAARGKVVDRYTNHRSGLLLIRARVGATAIDDLAQIDEVALIDGVPTLPPYRARSRRASAEDLPTIPAAAAAAPLIAVVDSGVRSAHPLIAPAFV
jgi:hypothetical protein